MSNGGDAHATIKLEGEYWLKHYQEKVRKFIITSPSKNLKARLYFNTHRSNGEEQQDENVDEEL
jgi:hypothetical protein